MKIESKHHISDMQSKDGADSGDNVVLSTLHVKSRWGQNSKAWNGGESVKFSGSLYGIRQGTDSCRPKRATDHKIKRTLARIKKISFASE